MNVRTLASRSLLPFAAAAVAGLCSCAQPSAPAEVAARPQAGAPASETRAAEPRSAPTQAPAVPRVTIPQGTELHMTLASMVSSKTSQVGDDITGTMTSAVVVGDAIAIPAGSTVFGRVINVDPATKGLKISEKGGGLVLSFHKVTTPGGYSSPLSGTFTRDASSNGKTAGIIGGSAAGGALLGKIVGGHTKDAAIGAVLGSGIGTGIAAGTKGQEVTIPAGTAIAITLDQPLTMKRS